MALRSFSSMKTLVFQWTGLNSDDTDHVNIVEGALNAAYKDILSALSPRTLRKEGMINTVAPYTTGTVTVVGTAVTGSGTAWDSSMENSFIQIDGLGDSFYQISSVGSATSLTLFNSVSATISSAATYSIFKSDYSLGGGVDEDSLEVLIDTKNSREIRPLSSVQLETMWPNLGNATTGEPEYFSLQGRDSSNQIIVRLYPIPDDIRSLKYIGRDGTLADMSADADVPEGLPEKHQDIILEGAKALVFSWMSKDQKAAYHQDRYEKYLGRVSRDDRKSERGYAKLASQFDARADDGFGLRLPGNYPPYRF